jgi:hypothetical protein
MRSVRGDCESEVDAVVDEDMRCGNLSRKGFRDDQQFTGGQVSLAQLHCSQARAYGAPYYRQERTPRCLTAVGDKIKTEVYGGH